MESSVPLLADSRETMRYGDVSSGRLDLRLSSSVAVLAVFGGAVVVRTSNA